MAVDLVDLVPSVERETSPPGTDLFPDAVEDDWLGQLQDSFWEARLFGFFDGFSEADGLVSPLTTGDDDLGRDQQQLIVLFAGIRSIRLKLLNTNTKFHAKAGPVEFETAQSANLLQEILKELNKKIQLVLDNFSSTLGNTQDYYVNAVLGRQDSLDYGDEFYWK